MRRGCRMSTWAPHRPTAVASRAPFITGKSTDSRRKLPGSSISPGSAVSRRDARTLTEPKAAALAEMVKADMITCE